MWWSTVINFELASKPSEAIEGLNKPLESDAGRVDTLLFYADERLPLANSVVSNAALPKFYFAPNKNYCFLYFLENFKVMKMQF